MVDFLERVASAVEALASEDARRAARVMRATGMRRNEFEAFDFGALGEGSITSICIEEAKTGRSRRCPVAPGIAADLRSLTGTDRARLVHRLAADLRPLGLRVYDLRRAYLLEAGA